MAGRQSHGRAPTSKPLGNRARKRKDTHERKNPNSKAAHQAKALDAYQIAAGKLLPESEKKKTARERLAGGDGSTRPVKKHARAPEGDASGGGDDNDEAANGPRRKRPRPTQPAGKDSDVEEGSDDDGNTWRLGGLAEDDDDSEIESDDAFGESDEEKFKDFTFGGSKSKRRDDDSQEEDDDESLGEDAIDLATALDQASEESSEPDSGTGSEGSDDSGSESDPDAETSNLKDIVTKYAAPEDDFDPKKSKKVQFAILDGDEEVHAGKAKGKISLSDLGLSSLGDINMRKSVKLMAKEEKESRPGESKKVLKPLPKLHQDRIDRQAALETTTKTLDRWTETIKTNRRAEHLVFPLPQERLNAGLANTEFHPLNAKSATSELEQTMLQLLGPSGFEKEPKKKKKKDEDQKEAGAPQGISHSAEEIRQRNEELAQQRRREREMQSREAKKNARLKKIKSKAFHRVHRKQKLRDLQNGDDEDDAEMDSEAEREEHDRRRALERVGVRHRDGGGWGRKAKRAIWDDDYRTGLTEGARREHELRKRIEGRTGSGSENGDNDSEEESASDSEGERDRLLRKVDALEQENDGKPANRLMALKFMQNAEARKRQENEKLIEDIRRTLGDGEEEEERSEDEDIATITARKSYGPVPGGPSAGGVLVSSKEKKQKKTAKPVLMPVAPLNGRDKNEDRLRPSMADENGAPAAFRSKSRSKSSRRADLEIAAGLEIQTDAPADETPHLKTKESGGRRIRMVDDDDDSDAAPAQNASAAAPNLRPGMEHASRGLDLDHDVSEVEVDDDDEEDGDMDNGLASPTDLLGVEMFGGGDDVEDDFALEKAALVDEQGDQTVDKTLPGWGTWVGDGLSEREQNRNKGRFVEVIKGVKKKDRKDAKLERVIISEQRVKKNERFLASTLPYPYESREQYEQSLRLPMGKEWVTKMTFQDGTKPRVIVKPGIIAPISRPTA